MPARWASRSSSATSRTIRWSTWRRCCSPIGAGGTGAEGARHRRPIRGACGNRRWGRRRDVRSRSRQCASAAGAARSLPAGAGRTNTTSAGCAARWSTSAPRLGRRARRRAEVPGRRRRLPAAHQLRPVPRDRLGDPDPRLPGHGDGHHHGPERRRPEAPDQSMVAGAHGPGREVRHHGPGLGAVDGADVRPLLRRPGGELAVGSRSTAGWSGSWRAVSADSRPGPTARLVAVRQMAETMVQAAERLVQRQTELWQASMDAAAARWTQWPTPPASSSKRALAAALAESLRDPRPATGRRRAGGRRAEPPALGQGAAGAGAERRRRMAALAGRQWAGRPRCWGGPSRPPAR